MVFDPNMPSYMDDDFEARWRAAMAGVPIAPVDIVPPPPEQVSTVEYTPTLGTIAAQDAAKPPPPPPPPQKLGPILGANPTADEVAAPRGWPPKLDHESVEAAPPSLEVDAISGGPAAKVADFVNVSTERRRPPTPEEIEQQTAERTADAPLLSLRDRSEEQGGQDLAVAMSRRSPEEQAMFLAKIERSRDNFAATRALQESEKTRQQHEDLARIRAESIAAAQKRREQADAEARRIAETDPTSYIPGYRKLFGVLASIAGGFAANRTGRNMGLETVNQIAEEAAQHQAQLLKVNAQKRAGIGEEINEAEEAYRIGEAARLATYDVASKALEAEIQLYDPRGATAARMLKDLSAIKAQRAASTTKYELDEQKRIEEALKVQREVTRDAEVQRHNIAQEKTAATSAYADVLRAKAEKTKAEAEAGASALLTADELRARGVNIPQNAQVPPMTLKQAKGLAETAKSVEDWQKAARENSPQEQARQLGVGELVDVNGAALKFRNPESAEKVATLKASADFGVQLLDRLIDARAKYGWSSDLFKSPEWREMRADFAQFALEKKNVDQLGVLAGPDMGLIHDAAGTSDPTEMRDPTPGLKRARANVIEKLNANVHAQIAPGVTPKRWDPPPPPPPAPTTPEQEAIKDVLNYDPKRIKRGEGNSSRALADPDGYLPPQYASRIDRLVGVFFNPDATPEEQKQAGAFLEEIKGKASSRAVRDYAIKAASDAVAGSIPVPKEEP